MKQSIKRIIEKEKAISESSQKINENNGKLIR